ncbi:hypothetical protein AGMMS4956_17770 [Bacteroidia bacterium]|nr:hypothetical protein AGMMS4956_17770 [Bacteroidia bacterium]
MEPMKNIFLFLCLASSVVATAQPDTLWQQANNNYAAGNYTEAAQNYASLVEQGVQNAALYYNTANAYYKQNDVARAILYYERALALAPSDEDVIYNLEIARLHTIDKIDAVPVFFAVRWLNAVQQSLSADAWGYVSIFAFVATLLCLLFALVRRRGGKKIALVCAIVLFAFSITAMVTAIAAKNSREQHHHAIVMQPVATVKSSPDNSGVDLFILHEGTKVQTIETIGKWTKVKTADGNQGWMPLAAIEAI